MMWSVSLEMAVFDGQDPLHSPGSSACADQPRRLEAQSLPSMPWTRARRAWVSCCDMMMLKMSFLTSFLLHFACFRQPGRVRQEELTDTMRQKNERATVSFSRCEEQSRRYRTMSASGERDSFHGARWRVGMMVVPNGKCRESGSGCL